MATRLEKLLFSIDLMDRVTGPAGKIQKTLGGVANVAQESFGKITAGFAGVAASGYAIKALAGPAQEFNMAIGSVRSLDVAQKSLDILSDKAIEFSLKYGESAKDFVSSSYDIQSSIRGLAGSDLADFTYASGVMAKATKADTATATKYIGKMYNIFEKSADAMGKKQWVDQLTGQTAVAVNMYRTTGDAMTAAFTGLGSSAISAGISQAEQLAVLGNLQGAMEAGVSGTSYTAFLSNVGRAQEKLGLKFTDSAGEMLAMPDILSKIHGKFGDLKKVADSDIIKNAFGSEEAVKLIKALLPKTAALAADIKTFGDIKGADKAIEMAEDFIDPFQQWDQGIQAVRIGLGQALLPVLLPAVTSMAEGAGAIYNWTKEYPGLTKWIGYSVVLISGLTGAVAGYAVMGGIASMVTGFYTKETKTASFWTKIFGKESIFAKWAMTGWSVAMKIASGGMAVLKWALGGARTGFLWLNAAMYANPVGFVIAGVVALTAGVAAAIYYWDDLKKAFLDSSWGQSIMGWIDKIIGGFKSMTGSWDWVMDKVSWIPGMGEDPAGEITKTPSFMTGASGWVKDKMSWIPGMGDDPAGEIPKTSPSLAASRRSVVLPGGAGRSIANAVTHNNQSNSSNVHIGQIVTSRPINSQEISGQLAMAGG